MAPCPSTQTLKSHTYASGDGCLCVWEAMHRDEVRSGRQHYGLLKPQTTLHVHSLVLTSSTNPDWCPVHFGSQTLASPIHVLKSGPH